MINIHTWFRPNITAFWHSNIFITVDFQTLYVWRTRQIQPREASNTQVISTLLVSDIQFDLYVVSFDYIRCRRTTFRIRKLLRYAIMSITGAFLLVYFRKLFFFNNRWFLVFQLDYNIKHWKYENRNNASNTQDQKDHVGIVNLLLLPVEFFFLKLCGIFIYGYVVQNDGVINNWFYNHFRLLFHNWWVNNFGLRFLLLDDYFRHLLFLLFGLWSIFHPSLKVVEPISCLISWASSPCSNIQLMPELELNRSRLTNHRLNVSLFILIPIGRINRAQPNLRMRHIRYLHVYLVTFFHIFWTFNQIRTKLAIYKFVFITSFAFI